MNLFLTAFESIAVLIGIGVVGFWIIKRNIVSEKAIDLLSPLSLEIALPALIFVNIISNFSPDSLSNWWQLPLWWLFFTFIAIGLSWIGSLISKKNTRPEFRISLLYQNAIFVPLAILTGIFGSSSKVLVYLFIFALFYPAFLFSTYLFFLGEKKFVLKWDRILHLVFIVTLIAVSIKLAGIDYMIPSVVMSILNLLGGMAVPLLMLVIGANLYLDYKGKGRFNLKEVVKFVSIKNILFPLVFLGILLIVSPGKYIALIILIQAAAPPVTAVPVLTKKAGGDQRLVNQFFVASILLTVITIPFFIYMLDMFFNLQI
ncbi:MAG: AEC family transporter [Thermoplasmatota archaeon]